MREPEATMTAWASMKSFCLVVPTLARTPRALYCFFFPAKAMGMGELFDSNNGAKKKKSLSQVSKTSDEN